VPAQGFMPYQYAILPHRFEHDTWIQKIEMLATEPAVLHHANLFFLRPGQPFDRAQILAGKVPGGGPLDLEDGCAVLVPKGALLTLQLHLQPIGVAVESRVSVGLSFPRGVVRRQFRSAVLENRDFTIPPGDPHHRLDAAATFDEEVIVGGLFGHMHLRGKDYTFRATYPDGRVEILLQVPSYNFAWQMAYELREPRRFPAGTRIDCTAHFDNTRFNPWNPDATRPVRFGLQSTAEMLYGVVFFVRAAERLNVAVDPRTGAAR
jgi:hypothetical protein